MDTVSSPPLSKASSYATDQVSELGFSVEEHVWQHKKNLKKQKKKTACVVKSMILQNQKFST